MLAPLGTEKKNTCTIKYLNTSLTVSGNFDSGNLNWAQLDSQKNEIQLWFGRDRELKPSPKCWFYFSVEGFYNYLPVQLLLQNTNSLSMVAKIYDLYRPVVKVEGGEWNRHREPVEFEISPDNDISFRMNLQLYGCKKFYVALCYPWSLTDNEEYLWSLQQKLWKRKDIYYNRQTLILSPQNRPLDLLALSSREVNEDPPEQYIQHLFPRREQQSHFKSIRKPLIMITCRVHPGEIGSSHALKGMLEFLTGGTFEARKIISEFYFLIVPILNPDGVFQGNNRMDSLGQNLNRFYLLPELEKQPSCFAIKALLQNYRHQLFAFFDLHGHTNKKSCFLFGNSISNHQLQVESVLFAKHLSNCCGYVEFRSCNFSKKQMSSKDKGQDFSKQGCARVVANKWTSSPYCYTLETGLYKNVKVDEKGIQRYGEEFYNPNIYAEVGAKMILSIYAIFKKDKHIELLRKQASIYVTRMQKANNRMQKAGNKTQKGSMKLQKVNSRPQKTSKNSIGSMKTLKFRKQKQEYLSAQINKVHSFKETEYRSKEKFKRQLQRAKKYLPECIDD